MTQDEVLRLMAGATNEAEWDERCAQVKAAHGGAYPAYWWPKVMEPRLAQGDKSLAMALADLLGPDKS